MANGNTVLMEFDDGSFDNVPADSASIAIARKHTGKIIQRRPLAPASAQPDVTNVDQPAVVSGAPPRPTLSTMSPVQFVTMSSIGNMFGVRDSQGQLEAFLAGLDAVPGTAGLVADVTAPGARSGIGRASLAGMLAEPVREVGYRALGQQHLLPGGVRGMIERSVASGAGQGLATGTGRGIGGAMKWSGGVPHDLAADALKLPTRRAAISGDVGKTYLEENVPVGRRGTFSGRDEIMRRFERSIAEEDRIAAEAHAKLVAGGRSRVGIGGDVPRINRSEIANRAYARIMKNRGAGLLKHEKDVLKGLVDEFSTQDLSSVSNPSVEIPQSVQEALQIKRMYDLRHSPTHIREESGRAAIPSHLEQEWSGAIADEARAWLKTKVPALAGQLNETRKLLYLKGAMENAEASFERAGKLNPLSYIASRENLGKAALALRVPARWMSGARTVKYASQIPRMVAGRFITPPLEGE